MYFYENIFKANTSAKLYVVSSELHFMIFSA